MSEHNEGAPSVVPQPEEKRFDQLLEDGAILSADVEQALHPRGFSQLRFARTTELSAAATNKLEKACGVPSPTFEDLYKRFCKPGTDREFHLGKVKGIGEKTAAQIIEAFLDDQIIIDTGDGRYEFHPRVFNALPAEWCELHAEPGEMEAMARVFNLSLEDLRELPFQTLYLNSVHLLAHADEADAATVAALFEKAGFTSKDRSGSKWSSAFNDVRHMEVYGPELFNIISFKLACSVPGKPKMGTGFNYVSLLRIFDQFNPLNDQDLSFEHVLERFTHAGIPTEQALIFISGLAEEGFAVHLGLAVGEEAKAQTKLNAFREAREARKRNAEVARDTGREKLRQVAEQFRLQQHAAGIRLDVDSNATISQLPLENELEIEMRTWNLIAPAIASFAEKDIDELTVQDLFEFLDGNRSQKKGSRQAHFDLLVGIPGVAAGTRRRLIENLVSNNILVTRTDELQGEEDILNRNHDFHPRIYKGGIGEWIAVRVNEEELGFVAGMFGMDSTQVIALGFNEFNSMLFKWRDLVGGRTQAEKDQLLEILRRTGLFDLRRTNLGAAPRPWGNELPMDEA